MAERPELPQRSSAASPGPYAPPAQAPPDGPDPIVGEADAGLQCLLVQASGQHQFPITTQLIHVTAGEYFFVPSLSSLEAIAAGASE